MATDHRPGPSKAPAFPTWLTSASVLALIAGTAVGLLGNVTDSGLVDGLAELLRPVGEVWMFALRTTVVPLVVVQMMAAVLNAGADRGLGSLASKSVGLFVLMLLGGSFSTVAISGPILSLYDPPAGIAESIRESVGERAIADATAAGTSGVDVSWIPDIPSLWDLLTGRAILPLLVLALLAGILLLRLPGDRRVRATRTVNRLSHRLLILVRWILYATPAAVFVIILTMTLSAGAGVAGAAVFFVVSLSAILFGFTLVLYPVTWLATGLPVRRFARAVLPAQLVATSTRSSLASLPALVEEAENDLGLPDRVTGMVLPLSVSTFKMNRGFSSTFKLLFLAHLMGIPLALHSVAAFIATFILLSFTSIGVPRGGGGMRSLPIYIAAGIPVEAYLLAEAVDDIPDIFKTVINVTADMSVAVILTGRRTIATILALESSGTGVDVATEGRPTVIEGAAGS